MKQILPTKATGVTQLVQFDFTNQLGTGESLTSGSVGATVYSGVDATPSAIVSGSATVASPLLEQLVTGGVAGTLYSLVATTNTSAGQILQLQAFLAVQGDPV